MVEIQIGENRHNIAKVDENSSPPEGPKREVKAPI